MYFCKVIKNENKMKTTEIKFGKGKDSVTHVIETSKVNEYLIQLANAGWNLSEITKITNL